MLVCAGQYCFMPGQEAGGVELDHKVHWHSIGTACGVDCSPCPHAIPAPPSSRSPCPLQARAGKSSKKGGGSRSEKYKAQKKGPRCAAGWGLVACRFGCCKEGWRSTACYDLCCSCAATRSTLADVLPMHTVLPPSIPPGRLDKRMRKDQRGQQRAEKRMKGKGGKAAGGVKAGKAGKNRRR